MGITRKFLRYIRRLLRILFLPSPPSYICEQCSEIAVVKITFASKTKPSSIEVCDKCAKQIFEQYRKMGKPGQIIIQPIDSL